MNTEQKIAIARIIFFLLQLARVKRDRIVTRKGIVYELDLREGIDLSIFLFGAFQDHVAKIARRYVPENGICLDVGANVGAISLPLARQLKKGTVYAIEPTDYAYAKLCRNISHNPKITARIIPVHAFISDQSSVQSNLMAYSSWTLSGKNGANIHPVHGGTHMAASCGTVTLDEFVAAQKLDTISLIKIDTDGHEYRILCGAQKTLEQYRPVIVFEACQYLMTPPAPAFSDFEQFLHSHAYRIFRIDRSAELTAEMFERECPPKGSMELLALPDEETVLNG